MKIMSPIMKNLMNIKAILLNTMIKAEELLAINNEKHLAINSTLYVCIRNNLKYFLIF